ncbi:hypothetical protein JCM10212_004666 [Sporobolomyces blumeae]
MLHLFLIREPRSLVLCSNDYALVLRNPPSTSNPSTTPLARSRSSSSRLDQQDQVQVVVELLPRDEVNLDYAVTVNARVSGSLGILNVANETFLAVISASTTLGSTHSRPFTGTGTEPISQILAVDFVCLSSPTYDHLHGPVASASAHGGGAFDPSVPTYVDESSRPDPSNPAASAEHPCAQIRKILSNASFYFSSSGQEAFDLSTRLQGRIERTEKRKQERTGSASLGDENPTGSSPLRGGDAGEEEPDDPASSSFDYDKRFLYNHFLVAPFLSFRSSLSPSMRRTFDREGFVVLAIQGFCGVYKVSVAGQPAILSLTSRLGWKRAGTRFNVRGVDDDGGVANFVETETILRTESLCFSYVQTRGSVPVFWEEGGGQPFNPKITITRPLDASLPAFLRHFEDLLETYSPASIHILNLLSQKEGELALSSSYASHLAEAKQVDEAVAHSVAMTEFDFHRKTKVAGGIEYVKRMLADETASVQERFGAFVVGVEKKGEDGEEELTQVMRQSGIFRTNCKDVRFYLFCLDRTNAVQDCLSAFSLSDFIRHTTDPSLSGLDASLWAAHRTLWADNGDALSKAYVGTGAINSSFTRSGKKSFAGMLSDASKSVNRVFQQQLFDSGKQKAIDALLGNLATSRKVRIFDPLNDTLRAMIQRRADEYTSYHPCTVWVGTFNLNGRSPGTESLLPWVFPSNDYPEPAFLVFAFQEIVPLSPQMIMATDPEKQRKWEQHIMETVSNRPDKRSDYILLRSGQLVGTALIVLCQKEIVGDVRNVEVATKKTGLRGMAGNKGAVAIRLDYHSTSFCFLTAHLAAGFANVDERNENYFTISEGLHFSRGRHIDDHENIVWAADTNYRISLSNEEARNFAETDDYDALYEADQLRMAMATRHVFKGYQEAPIVFRPTYKYDIGTDIYDTSEKNRIPAYTDRILYKGDELDVSRYARAELRSSDHRPVYAILRASIRNVDQEKRSSLRKTILQELVAHGPDEKLDDKLARLMNGVAPADLPPPSDDVQAWWNDQDGNFHPPSLSIPSRARSSTPSAVPNNRPAQRKPTAPVPRKPVPPPAGPPVDDLLGFATPEPGPSNAPSVTSATSSAVPTTFQAVRRKAPPPPKTRSPSGSISLLSRTDSTDSIALAARIGPPAVPRRPGDSKQVERQTTGDSWQVIEP